MHPTALYRSHLATLDRWLEDALQRAGRAGSSFDGVLFHAGRERCYHADDEAIPFWATPHYRRWVPLGGPEHMVLARPGAPLQVIRVSPRDYWFDTSPPAPSYWEEAVRLLEVESLSDAKSLLGSLDRVAFVGGAADAAAELGIAPERIEPAALMAPLDWHRAIKTEHEVRLLEEAVAAAVAGHLGAREVFAAGGSEREIYWAYLESSEHTERELPFSSIVALDEKAAILHYQRKRGPEKVGKVLLVDAGAGCEGYAADLTRTWAAADAEPLYVELLHGVDALERKLVAMVTPGRPYPEIHLAAHREVADLLSRLGVLRVSADEALDRGLTHPFLPHGVGHHLGIQVHDIGGRQASPDGGILPPPEEHPFLRNTRTLEPGHVVTIEPGIYFIPLLLDPLREDSRRSAIDWGLIDRLLLCGGVRIEDDVLCTAGGPRDLSRDHLPGPRGE